MPRKSTRPKANLRSWRVIEIAKKGRHVAELRATDADAAVRQAIELYGIKDPYRQRRLVATPVE